MERPIPFQHLIPILPKGVTVKIKIKLEILKEGNYTEKTVVEVNSTHTVPRDDILGVLDKFEKVTHDSLSEVRAQVGEIHSKEAENRKSDTDVEETHSE